jgi:hypothetical protein
MTFKVISVSLSKDTISVPLTFVPLTLVDVFVGIYHSSLALRHSSDPVTIIAVSVLVEESASAVLFVLDPISGVFTTKLAALVSPVGALSMTLIPLPQALILVAVLIKVYSEAVLLIVFPIAYVSGCMLPLLTLDASILLSLLLLNPVDRSVSAILLGFVITHLPELGGPRLLERVVHLRPSIHRVASADARSISHTLKVITTVTSYFRLHNSLINFYFNYD